MDKAASWLPVGLLLEAFCALLHGPQGREVLVANNSNFDNNALWLVLGSSLSPCSVILAASQLTTCIQIIVSGSAFGETCLMLLFDKLLNALNLDVCLFISICPQVKVVIESSPVR